MISWVVVQNLHIKLEQATDLILGLTGYRPLTKEWQMTCKLFENDLGNDYLWNRTLRSQDFELPKSSNSSSLKLEY